jgi:hypothetical protein
MDLQRWLRNQWDRALAIAAVLLGAVSLLLGWIGISDAKLPAQQIPYLASGGLVGLFALGIGATCWLSADLRDEWRKLDDIYRRLGDDDEQSETVAFDVDDATQTMPKLEVGPPNGVKPPRRRTAAAPRS